MATLAAPRSTAPRAGEFKLNSPPQLREVLYGELGLQPGKKTPKGELSTDASVLEKLRDAHPIVDGILSWRELDKLNSTYLRGAARSSSIPRTGASTPRSTRPPPRPAGSRARTRTCRTCPVRSEVGRPDPPGVHPRGPRTRSCWWPTTRRSSCGSWRTCPATRGLRDGVRERGRHPRRHRRRRSSGCRWSSVDGELRRRAKAVNYGLAYGMNAWGLAQRLDLAPDEAQEIMDGYFAGFPKIKEYLRAQVERARLDGYTETILGRRRYIPELTSDNRRHPRAGGAPGAERADPGQRERHLQGRDDPRRPRARGRPPTSAAGCC